MDTLHQPVGRVITLDRAGSDRGEGRAARGLGYRVGAGGRRGALMPANTQLEHRTKHTDASMTAYQVEGP